MEQENSLTEIAFEPADREALLEHLRILVLATAVISFIIAGLLALLSPVSPDRQGDFHVPGTLAAYWQEVGSIFLIGLLVVFVICGLLLFLPVLRDLQQPVKYQGRILIREKYQDRGMYYFAFGPDPAQTLKVSFRVYEDFSAGDRVELAFTKRRRHILRIKKLNSLLQPLES